MARRPKYSEQDFPPPGTVFAASTRDGRFAVGRVLQRTFHGGAQGALIAASPWLGKELPSLNLKKIQEILHLNHHKWKNKQEVFWVHDPMPSGFIILGQSDLSPRDLSISSDILSGWQSVPIQALLQWRWDHDREALLLDEERHATALAESQRQRAAVRAEFMRTLTLDFLANRNWFDSWQDQDTGSSMPLHECRSLIAKLISELRAAPKLTLGFVKKLLKKTVNELNRLNAEHHFIATIQREDIYEALEQILCAAKFPQAVNQIDQWRDW